VRSAVDVFAPMKLPALPVYDYLDQFTEMLSFVEPTYASDLAVEPTSINVASWRIAVTKYVFSHY
jgi:hypothetical protein